MGPSEYKSTYQRTNVNFCCCSCGQDYRKALSFEKESLLFRTVGGSKSTLWQSETCHLVLLVFACFPETFFSLFYFSPALEVVTLVSRSPDVGVPPHSFPNLFLLLFLETKSSSVCLHWFCESIYLCQPGEFYEKTVSMIIKCNYI